MYFCTSFSYICQEKIYNTIKKLRDSNIITWLRNQMPYRIFTDLGKILQGSLVIKLSKGLESKYFINRECKCNLTMKVNGMCAYTC